MAFKTRQGDIVFCDICHCSLSSKDRVGHQSACSESKPLTDDVSKLDHPVIHEHLLLAKCQILTNKEIQDRINFSISKKVILLHPATMKCCHIYFGRPVVLNQSAVFTAWANPSVPVNGIAMEKEVFRTIKPLSSSDLIMVEPLGTDCIEASTLQCTLNADDPSLKKNDQFTNYVTKVYVNRYVTTGSIIYVDFYGKECELNIVKITGADGSELSEDIAKFITNEEIVSSPVRDTDASGVLDDMSNVEVDKIAQDLQNQCAISGDVHGSTSTPAKTRHSKDGYFHGLPPKRVFYVVSHNTKLTFLHSETDPDEVLDVGPTLEDFGGYDDQVNRLKEMVHNHLFRSDLIRSKGLYCPQSILLYGPSGSGKTMLATTIGRHFPVHFIVITGADVWSKYYGETEARLRSFFNEAKERAPSILFLDDINVLCSKRETSRSEAERRVISTILTLLDGISSSPSNVFIIAATNKRNDLDKAIRRPGRLETELEIGVPSVEDRCKILECILRNTDHSISSDSLHDIGERAHGFLGADLSSVCKEAMLRTMQRGAQKGLSGEPPPLSLEDLAHGFQIVKPSAMKEVALEIAKVSWDDIGGQEDLKHKLRQSVEWPLKHPEVFTRMGIRPPRGLLMYGPPGCSKTMIAKALAKESGLNFIAIKGPELFSKWVGESERAVRDLFARARTAAPAIIFFDEIDALATSRGSDGGGGADVSGRVLAQLLTEMDGVESLEDIMVVAATNRPDKIDKALMRPGRLDRIVYVPLPDADTRRSIFKIKFRATPTASDVDVDELVSKTEKYSGAEVTAVCHEAALAAMQEDINIEHVFRRHFLQALETITPRVTPELMAIYEKYQQHGAR